MQRVAIANLNIHGTRGVLYLSLYATSGYNKSEHTGHLGSAITVNLCNEHTGHSGSTICHCKQRVAISEHTGHSGSTISVIV